ncbi:hypothetical protein ACNKHM_04340 [Shigella sonnei]
MYTGGTLAAEWWDQSAGDLGVEAERQPINTAMMLDADGYQILDLGDEFSTPSGVPIR